MTNIGKVTLAGLLAMVLGTAWSQEESASGQRGSLEVKTVVQKLSETVNENGEAQTELVEIDTAVPGDQVVYTEDPSAARLQRPISFREYTGNTIEDLFRAAERLVQPSAYLAAVLQTAGGVTP